MVEVEEEDRVSTIIIRAAAARDKIHKIKHKKTTLLLKLTL
jgi:hypothetical protein